LGRAKSAAPAKFLAELNCLRAAGANLI